MPEQDQPCWYCDERRAWRERKAPGPWMKFWVRDYMANARVQAMTDRERGVYHWWLFLSWTEDGLVNDDKVLAGLIRGKGANGIARSVKSMFTCCPCGARLFHPKVLEERRNHIGRSLQGTKAVNSREDRKSTGVDQEYNGRCTNSESESESEEEHACMHEESKPRKYEDEDLGGVRQTEHYQMLTDKIGVADDVAARELFEYSEKHGCLPTKARIGDVIQAAKDRGLSEDGIRGWTIDAIRRGPKPEGG